MAQGQIIIRRKKTNETRIQNSIIWDENISTMARFSLIAMLSMREGWDYSVRGMATMLHVSKDTMSKYIRDLEEAGYLKRTQIQGENGQFGRATYVLTDVPWDFGEEPCPKNYDTEPCPSFPAPEKPAPKKSPQQIRSNKQQNDKEKNKTPKAPKRGLKTPGFVWDCVVSFVGDDPEYQAAFAGLLENREALKKPVLTTRSMNTIINKLRKVSREEGMAMLDKATNRNWLTVFPLDEDERPAAVCGDDGRRGRCL